MPSKTLQILAGVSTMVFIAAFMPSAQAVDVEGQVTIVAADCGIVINGGSPIQYGSLKNNEQSAEQTLTFANNGNTEGDVYVRGNDWSGDVGGVSAAIMPVGTTSWSSEPADPASTTLPLTDSDALALANVSPAVAGNNLYWRVHVDLNQAGFSGTGFAGDAVQTVTLTSFCE